jgi:hypothetical protein
MEAVKNIDLTILEQPLKQETKAIEQNSCLLSKVYQ